MADVSHFGKEVLPASDNQEFCLWEGMAFSDFLLLLKPQHQLELLYDIFLMYSTPLNYYCCACYYLIFTGLFKNPNVSVFRCVS